MPTECSAEHFDFGTVEGRAVEAAFDGGLVSSDAGALLLGATDRAIGMIDRFAACFHDERREDLIVNRRWIGTPDRRPISSAGVNYALQAGQDGILLPDIGVTTGLVLTGNKFDNTSEFPTGTAPRIRCLSKRPP